jgi:hypothetical protein
VDEVSAKFRLTELLEATSLGSVCAEAIEARLSEVIGVDWVDGPFGCGDLAPGSDCFLSLACSTEEYFGALGAAAPKCPTSRSRLRGLKEAKDWADGRDYVLGAGGLCLTLAGWLIGWRATQTRLHRIRGDSYV